jgi:hypothetical protein
MLKSAARQLMILCTFGILMPTAVFASHEETDVVAILNQLETNRKLLVAENMNLAEDRKAGFWKVYDAYRAELMELNKQSFLLLSEFRDHFEELTDERANKILESYFEIEQKRLKIGSRYVANFNKVVRPRQTLRFYQIENKIESIIQSDITSVTPLVN